MIEVSQTPPLPLWNVPLQVPQFCEIRHSTERQQEAGEL